MTASISLPMCPQAVDALVDHLCHCLLNSRRVRLSKGEALEVRALQQCAGGRRLSGLRPSALFRGTDPQLAYFLMVAAGAPDFLKAVPGPRFATDTVNALDMAPDRTVVLRGLMVRTEERVRRLVDFPLCRCRMGGRPAGAGAQTRAA